MGTGRRARTRSFALALVSLVVAACWAGPASASPIEGRGRGGLGPRGELRLPPITAGAAALILDPEEGNRETLALFRVGSEFAFWRLSLGLDVRLAVDDDGRLRHEDWDEPSDWPRVVRWLEFGAHRDVVHVRAGTLTDATVGHGTIVSHYATDTDFDSPHTGAQIDIDLGTFGFELFTNDIVTGDVSAVRGFIAPLFWTEWLLLEDIRVGATVAVDREAPDVLIRDAIGRVSIDSDDNIRFEDDALAVYGVDIELPLVDLPILKVVPYADYDFISGHGSGAHAGTLLTFDLPMVFHPQLHARAEYRRLQAEYIPDYFDTFYEIDRYRYPELSSTTTKREFISETSARHGWLAEARLVIPEQLEAGVIFEDGEEDDDGRVHGFVELNSLEWIRFQAHYVKRGIDALDEIASFDEHTYLSARLQVQVYSVLWLDMEFRRTWRLDDETREYVPLDSYTPGILLVFQF